MTWREQNCSRRWSRAGAGWRSTGPRGHYGILFGDLESAEHVAVIVPGVGNDRNLRSDWIPSARNLYEAAATAAVILWKGYDNPRDLLAAAVGTVECDAELMSAGKALAQFVDSISLRPGQTLTLVTHSFGSIVTGAALADCGLRCTDVVVAGSPGMTVDGLRELHVTQSHFFSERAPGDVVAELGVFGSAPTAPSFGGTRMHTNAPGHVAALAHSSYFEPGSEALENIARVVTGRYADIVVHRSSFAEVAGAVVAWAIRLPTMPVRSATRRYRGPGFRLIINVCRAVDFGAAQTGNVIADALDESEVMLKRMQARIGDRGGDQRAEE